MTPTIKLISYGLQPWISIATLGDRRFGYCENAHAYLIRAYTETVYADVVQQFDNANAQTCDDLHELAAKLYALGHTIKSIHGDSVRVLWFHPIWGDSLPVETADEH